MFYNRPHRSLDDTYHCVQRVGFETAGSPPYWKVTDSWSADRSEAGFTRLPWRERLSGMFQKPYSLMDVFLERLRPS